MAQSLRLKLAGGLYQLASRGVRREAIYLAGAGWRARLEVLTHVCERFIWVRHGWGRMTDHYRVIVETAKSHLLQSICQLGDVYSQYVNRSYKRVGHFFPRRNKAILIEKECHLLELSRYVALNAARAGMTPDAAQRARSSYRAMVGNAPAHAWLQTAWVLRQLGTQRDVAVAQWCDFVRAGVGQPPFWDAPRGQRYLDSDVFVEDMQAIHNSVRQLSAIPRTQRRPMTKFLPDYKQMSTAAARAMAAPYASGDYATVSCAVKQCQKRQPEEMLECKT